MSEKEKALNTISNIDEWAETGEPAGKGLHLSRICAVFAAVALAAACGLGLSALLAGDMAGWIYAGIAAFMVAAVLLLVVFVAREVNRPLKKIVQGIKTKQTVLPSGAGELRFVIHAYNRMLEETRKTTEELTYEAMHDRLTGLLNRNAFEIFCKEADLEHAALLIMDVDDFKSINDTWGHDSGDRILKRVAEVLKQNFRSVDPVYRIGGDEFVVIMTRANSSLRDLVLDKVNQVNHVLLQGGDNIPPVSLSVGVAFCDRKNAQGDLLKDADTALYRVKQAGRCGCAVY